jgi:hypothetical protein
MFLGSQNIESKELFHLHYISETEMSVTVIFNIHICTCIGSLMLSLTYLLNPWSRVLHEKTPDFQLVKKFPEFYGTRRFITTFRNVRHLYLS